MMSGHCCVVILGGAMDQRTCVILSSHVVDL